ncbi:alpha-amylase family protein [Deinococcus ruber]|uniref:Alpha-amlyase n=1 Tax=Deinococcus ruber TaxID=1848197 RepID=A0A918F1V2_9DEIO|nr:alpha-amylase family protein [Deinococcus ruber]GGQ99858.1 alpha-amlyase [Deinococcus ruber]
MQEDAQTARLRAAFDDDRDAETFLLRRERYGPELLESLEAVYGTQAASVFERLTDALLLGYHERPADLRRLDEARLLRPDWLQQESMLGYVAYTDRFAGTLKDVPEHLDYLKELGVTYLHLMPLLKPRDGENDGGYAVQDYRAVRADLGTMHDLSALAHKLRGQGMSLCLDLVLNHVAQEHDWAKRAQAGEERYQNYFLMFPDRQMPDAYERTLPEVFPDFAPGNFTWDEASEQWVWTTFNRYQWDLNWANPDVFLEFVEILVYLANRGVEIFRLDAIAFIWKRLGTDCQNQPEVHVITRALRAALRIVAPAVAFKAEAIVAPTDLIHYLGRGVHHGKLSDLAYHNSLMVQLWSSLASRDVRLFETALLNFPPKPVSATWGMYVRCHDDIGWAISDTDTEQTGMSGPGHRHFLSDFYSGEYPGSFARGLVFQYNPRTGDRRISGSGASLAGLEKALDEHNTEEASLAVQRLLMMHAVVLGFGGVPLLYMGDELALLNDPDFGDTPEHAADNRWVHRPRMNWALAEQRRNPSVPAGQMYSGLRALVQARQHTPQLHASVESQVFRSPNAQVLFLARQHPIGVMLGLYNFSEHAQPFPTAAITPHFRQARDAISGTFPDLSGDTLTLPPYARLWLLSSENPS